MEIKQPVTETDYWEAIEGLGGFIWSTNHGLSHGRIEDPDGEISKAIKEAGELSVRFLKEISEKFGIIPPNDYPKVEQGQTLPPAPEGKTYYWDWYKKMKHDCYQRDYDGIICSACPFSEGVERMIDLGGVIPCSVFRGMIYHLRAPYECGMLTNWKREELYQKILNKSDNEVLLKFQNKEKELKEKLTKVPQ